MIMKVYQIVAVAKNGVIGKDNRLPWHLPADLKHFKKRTLGSTVIMGRRTFESIGKPLPGRENFVISRTFRPAGGHLFFFDSIEKALEAVKTQEAYIIGGADIFKQTLGLIDGIYLTRIDQEYEGDAFYPEIPDDFEEVEVEALQSEPKAAVVYYERKK